MEIGKPATVPQIEIEPVQDPVPRTEPRPVPEEPAHEPARERDPVPA